MSEAAGGWCSAVIVNYRCADETAAAAISILKQCPGANVVVVHNASEDLPELRSKIEGVEVVLVESSTNLGFGRGVNLGLRSIFSSVRSPYILLLNPDTQLGEGCLESLRDCLERNPSAGIAAPRIMLDALPRLKWYAGGTINISRGRMRVPGWLKPLDHADSTNPPSPVEFASGCAMLCRREMFERLQGFDPRLFMYEEDVDLSIRAARAGWTIMYVPGAEVIHRAHGAMRSKEEAFLTQDDWSNPHAAFYVFHTLKNRLLVFCKHLSGYQKMVFVSACALEFIMKAFRFLLHGRYEAFLAVPRAFIAAIYARNASPIENVTNHSK